jgi:hypothetical protein
MTNATLFIIFGSLLVSALASIIYMVLITTGKSSMKSQSLDIAEDLQRIDTKDPSAPRFSDKFIIHSSIP